MKVTPPRDWGKVLGLVNGRSCQGDVAPLSGTTVEIDGIDFVQTLSTGQDGTYALWLSSKVKDPQMIVAKDGYQPQHQSFKVKAGKSTRLDYTLQHTGC